MIESLPAAILSTSGRSLTFASSLDEYLRVLRAQVDGGARKFRISGSGELAEPFLARSAEFGDLQFVAMDDDPVSAGLRGVSRVPRSSAPAVFIFGSSGADVSARLHSYANARACTIVAPVTDHHSSRRHAWINSIPKAGTHLLIECLRAFGYQDPPSWDLPAPRSAFRPGFCYSLQHTSSERLASPLQHEPEFLQAFCNAVVVFIVRDPRDIAVSLAHYLARQAETVVLFDYMQRLSPSDRLAAAIAGRYPVPFYLHRGAYFRGTVRDLVLRYQEWCDGSFSNCAVIRFEDLIGPRGGGTREAQWRALWSLQLALHVDGSPEQAADKVFSESAATFRVGRVGQHEMEFQAEHWDLFRALPQDFMQVAGYSSAGPSSKAFATRGRSTVRARTTFSGEIPVGPASLATVGPRLVEAGYHGCNLVVFRGEYWALWREAGPIDLATADVAELERAGHCLAAPTLAELKLAVRLARRLESTRGLSAEEPTAAAKAAVPQPPALIAADFHGFNLVMFSGRTYALALDLPVETLADLDVEPLRASGRVFVADSPSDARLLVLGTCAERAHEEALNARATVAALATALATAETALATAGENARTLDRVRAESEARAVALQDLQAQLTTAEEAQRTSRNELAAARAETERLRHGAAEHALVAAQLQAQLSEKTCEAAHLRERQVETDALVGQLTIAMSESQTELKRLLQGAADHALVAGQLQAQLFEKTREAAHLRERQAETDALVGQLTTVMNESQTELNRLRAEIREKEAWIANLQADLVAAHTRGWLVRWLRRPLP